MKRRPRRAKIALYASRTNFILSFPMLLCMARHVARPAVLIETRSLNDIVARQVAAALAEDLGGGRRHRRPGSRHASRFARRVIAREPAILCGTDWARRHVQTTRSRDPPRMAGRATATRLAADMPVLQLVGRCAPDPHGRTHRAQFPADVVRRPRRRPAVTSRRSRAPDAASSIPARPCRACASRRNTPRAAAARKTIASGLYDMVLDQGKPHHRRRLDRHGHRDRATNFARHSGRSRGGIARRNSTQALAARRRTSSCSTSSRSTTCAIAVRAQSRAAAPRAKLEASGSVTLGDGARDRADRRRLHLHRRHHQTRAGGRPVDALRVRGMNTAHRCILLSGRRALAACARHDERHPARHARARSRRTGRRRQRNHRVAAARRGRHGQGRRHRRRAGSRAVGGRARRRARAARGSRGARRRAQERPAQHHHPRRRRAPRCGPRAARRCRARA